MKPYFLILATAVTLLCGTLPLQAGTLGPALQQAAESSDAQVSLPVIIRFVDQLDQEAVRVEVDRIARELHPDNAKKRKKKRRKLMRKMLVRNLKAVARDSKKRVRDFLKAHGEKSKLKLLWTQNSVAAVVPVYLLDELAGQDYVDHIVLDATIQAPGTGTPPSAPGQWNLDVTGVPTLWDTGNTGQDVVVATLDTGVDASHPDLGPRWRGGNNSWFDPYGQHSSPADVHGHGTQVMGLIVGGATGGWQVGMAPDSQWIAAKIFDDAGEATLSGIHEAFQWVLDPDGDSNTDDAPDIVNNSWDLNGTVNQCVQEFALDIALLKAADVAVVFAGGNYGSGANSSVSPANDPAVLAVGSVDLAFVVDGSSGRGANACDGGVYPHLVAPGVSVLTTDRMPQFYSVVSGTSFAVAHLAGGMAVLKSAFPDASATELEASLTDTASDLGVVGPDNDYGYGFMDLVAAYGHLASILGGGDAGSLQLSGASYSVDENVASLSVTVTRSGGSTGEVAVDFSTVDGIALAGVDYTATSGTLVFADGVMSRSFDVIIIDDNLYEGDKDFSVTLGNVQGGASLGIPVSAAVTILETDQDTDSDGVIDALDNCPMKTNADQADKDSNNVGDACEPPQVTGIWTSGNIVAGETLSLFVFGDYFDLVPGSTQVTVNGIQQFIVQTVTPEMLIVRVTVTPAMIGGPVTVTTSNGSAGSPTSFGDTAAGVTITSMWPATASVGDFVFVFGSGFVQPVSVSIGATPVFLVQVVSQDMLIMIVPPGATTGSVSVTTPAGSATSSGDLVVIP